MKNHPIIAASILAADWTKLGAETLNVLEAGADWIHFDVMDNHYVPNLGFTPQLCQALKDLGIKNPIDVHLQAKPIHNLIKLFANAGANHITFHPETSENVYYDIKTIQGYGLKAGLAIAPDVSLDILDNIKACPDLIVIMTVAPGFGGQTFLFDVLSKLEQARVWVDRTNPSIRLAVDGGVTLENINKAFQRGADTFMIGSTIFKSKHYAQTLKLLRNRVSHYEVELSN